MIKNYGHIFLTCLALSEHWRWYNLSGSFSDLQIKESSTDKSVPSNYNYIVDGLCTPDSEYNVVLSSRIGYYGYEGFTIIKNGKIITILEKNPINSGTTIVYPEYTNLRSGEHSDVLITAEDNNSRYIKADFGLNDYPSEDEYFQKTLIHNMISYENIEKVNSIKNQSEFMLSSNHISLLLDHNSLDTIIDLKNTEIKKTVLDKMEDELDNFKQHYNKAKNNEKYTYNLLYRNAN